MQLNVLSLAGNECVPHSFKEESIVCVCNATYCDTISNPELQENKVSWYTSTKDGKRLQLSVNNFSAKNESDNDVVLTVNSNEMYQMIYGFGGAMTDAAALNIKTLSNDTQQKLLE